MKDNRKFRDVVDDITSAEKDVDAELKAARLERHEGTRMSAEQKTDIIMLLIGVIGGLGFMFMLFILPMML